MYRFTGTESGQSMTQGAILSVCKGFKKVQLPVLFHSISATLIETGGISFGAGIILRGLKVSAPGMEFTLSL